MNKVAVNLKVHKSMRLAQKAKNQIKNPKLLLKKIKLTKAKMNKKIKRKIMIRRKIKKNHLVKIINNPIKNRVIKTKVKLFIRYP